MDYTKRQLNMKPIFDDNGLITNLSDILDYLKEEDDEAFLKEYLDALSVAKNDKKRTIDDISYKALYVNLTNRINELEKEKISNKNALEELKKQNPNLNGLSVIETKKYDNDSFRDIEYIKYVDELGNVTLLQCEGENSINDFISKHPDYATTWSAKDFFNYFKNNVHREVKLKTEEEIDHEKEDERNKKLDPDEELEMQEMTKVKEYAANNNIHVEPKMGVDSNGERIYTVGANVIKFKTDVNGKRELYVISDNDFDKEVEKNNQEYGNKIDNDEVETSSSENKEASEVIDETKEDTSFDKNKMQNEIEVINLDEFIKLVKKLYNGEIRTKEEKEKMYNFALAFISDLKDGRTIDYDNTNAIDCYMEYISEHPNDTEITPDETKLFEEYQRTIKKSKQKQLEKETEEKKNGNIKVLEMKPIDHQGNIITIVILEVTILVGILISFIAIVKK
jgi:hypothetical protein